MSLFRWKSRPSPEPQEVVELKKRFRFHAFLCILCGIMLGFSFPPSELGVLVCFGLVPLLIVLSDIDSIGTSLRYSYLAFFPFHLITLNWTGGYEHGNDPYMMLAGAITMIIHPIFYFIPIGAYVFVKKYLGGRVALLALPFLWVAYEYTHSLSEWSFPWLTIGNSQSYDDARIQFITWTGVYGISFWILIINALAFLLYSKLAQRLWLPNSFRSVAMAGLIILVYLLPSVHGWIVLANAPTKEDLSNLVGGNTITVGMVQSNVDPWEKWKVNGYQAVEFYLNITRAMVDQSKDNPPDLVLWPETAIPVYLITARHRTALERLRAVIDSLGVPVLTGLPHAVFYDDTTKAPPSAKRIKETGERYDAFNAAAFIQPGIEEVPWYGKMKMVPLAERVPYADAFYFLDVLRWGVGIGGWQIGPDTVIFRETKTGARFCTMICYESTYPAFVAAFVRKGAEFISIITIDSWWGRMSGAFQHHQYAIFRAVENRRWIARCAVGGMSSYIDPYGRVYDKTELFTQATLVRTIGRSNELTYYSEHGDLFSEVCLILAGLFVAGGTGQKFKNRSRLLSG